MGAKTIICFSLEPMDLDLQLTVPEPQKLQKMMFIYNALSNGWTVKKREDKYIFTKKHENRREVFLDSYLQTFIHANLLGPT